MRIAILADASDGAELMYLLEALVAINRTWLRANGAPSLYASGVRYKRERPGRERWQSIPFIIEAGWGDCEDLACWRIAELRESGELAALPRLTRVRTTWHVTLVRADGTVEDPSKRLGMRAAA